MTDLIAHHPLLASAVVLIITYVVAKLHIASIEKRYKPKDPEDD